MDLLDEIQNRHLERSWTTTITQRYKRMSCIGYPEKGDDVIVVSRKQTMTETEFRNLMNPDVEIVVPDDEFRSRCNRAKNECYRRAGWFFALEKFTDVLEYSSNISGIVIALMRLSVDRAVIICCVLIVVIILASIGDWKRLREKYSRLGHEFKMLANSKHRARLETFESLAISFGSNALFIDTSGHDE